MSDPKNNRILHASSSGSLPIASHDFEVVLTDIYPEEQQEILRFWFFTARKHNWNLTRLAKATGISTTVLYRLFLGTYPADPTSSLSKLDAARKSFQESSENPEFIDTSLAARIFAILDKTRALKNVSILWGRMGIGKTECLHEYIRRSPVGRTHFVRFPAGASFSHFVQHIGRSLGVAKSQNATNQRERIIQLLSAGQRLLIIDELHQAFLTTRQDTAVKCCEFLREISDVANCGLVLVGTELLEEHVFRGPHKDALKQLVDRGTVQVPLPTKATQKDYKKFLNAYGLDFPDPNQDPEGYAILTDLIKSAGLRKLTLHLRDGAAYAGKREEDYTWSHFVAAFTAIQSLAK